MQIRAFSVGCEATTRSTATRLKSLMVKNVTAAADAIAILMRARGTTIRTNETPHCFRDKARFVSGVKTRETGTMYSTTVKDHVTSGET